MANTQIPYADPGFLGDGSQRRFPLSTAKAIRDGWAALDTCTEYTDEQMTRIRAAFTAAASRLRIQLPDLTPTPEGA